MIQRFEVAAHADIRRTVGLQVKVASLEPDESREKFVDFVDLFSVALLVFFRRDLRR